MIKELNEDDLFNFLSFHFHNLVWKNEEFKKTLNITDKKNYDSILTAALEGNEELFNMNKKNHYLNNLLSIKVKNRIIKNLKNQKQTQKILYEINEEEVELKKETAEKIELENFLKENKLDFKNDLKTFWKKYPKIIVDERPIFEWKTNQYKINNEGRVT